MSLRIRARSQDIDDAINKQMLSRRQDQKIKDDITNKLYRLELDQIKPSDDVIKYRRTFRSYRPQQRHFTPEPVIRTKHALPTRSRRYSIAMSTPTRSDVIIERAQPLKVEIEPVAVDLYSYRQPINELETTRKAWLNAERSRSVGPSLITTDYDLPVKYTYVAPPTKSLSINQNPALSTSHSIGSNNAKNTLNASKQDLEQFEDLMKKTFGRQTGVNRMPTLLYTAPPYQQYHHSNVIPYSDWLTYYGVGGTKTSTCYALPDYYYINSSSPALQTTSTSPLDYYDYILYSPPTRVTPPPPTVSSTTTNKSYYGYYEPVSMVTYDGRQRYFDTKMPLSRSYYYHTVRA